MKIAVSQRELIYNNITYDCLEHGWYRLLQNHTLVPISNVSPVCFDFDMLILSGGDTTPNRTQTESMYYSIALSNGTPILGVCHGAFFINELHHGVNKKIEGHKNTTHAININNTTCYVNSFHTNSIAVLGKDLVTLATCTHDTTIEAFKHTRLPIWGLVWHPERTNGLLPNEIREIL